MTEAAGKRRGSGRQGELKSAEKCGGGAGVAAEGRHRQGGGVGHDEAETSHIGKDGDIDAVAAAEPESAPQDQQDADQDKGRYGKREGTVRTKSATHPRVHLGGRNEAEGVE